MSSWRNLNIEYRFSYAAKPAGRPAGGTGSIQTIHFHRRTIANPTTPSWWGTMAWRINRACLLLRVAWSKVLHVLASSVVNKTIIDYICFGFFALSCYWHGWISYYLSLFFRVAILTNIDNVYIHQSFGVHVERRRGHSASGKIRHLLSFEKRRVVEESIVSGLKIKRNKKLKSPPILTTNCIALETITDHYNDFSTDS